MWEYQRELSLVALDNSDYTLNIKGLEHHEGAYLVSSYYWGTLQYFITITTPVSRTLELEFAFKVETRFDCAGMYEVKIAFNGIGIDLRDMDRLRKLPAGVPFGEEIIIPFTCRTGVGGNEIVLEWWGKDNQFWRGWYGMRFKDPILRYRGTKWDRRRGFLLLRESLSQRKKTASSLMNVFQNVDVFRYITGYL